MIVKTIKTTKYDKSTLGEGVPQKLHKESVNKISHHSAKVFNLSKEEGIFPAELKKHYAAI